MKIGGLDITDCKIGGVQVSEVRIGSTLVWSSAPAYDADAQAFITAYSITDNTQKNAINNAVISLKAGTLWGKGDVILPLVGGNATAHRGNLKNATNGVTWNGGITHNANGVKFNGSTGYGNVAWNAPSTYNRTAAEFNKYAASSIDGWSGIYNGTYAFGMQLMAISPTQLRTSAVGANMTGSISIVDSWGVRSSIIENSSATGGKHYANNNVIYTVQPQSSPNGLNYFIGALNFLGSAALYNDRQQQFYYFGSALTSAEHTELVGIINTFNTSLGR